MTISASEIAAKRDAGRTWAQLGAEYGCKSERLRGLVRRWRENNPGPVAHVKNEGGAVAPIVDGIMPDDDILDPDELWRHVETVQARIEERARKRKDQSITFPGNLPVGVALLSDAHIGSTGTDYRQLRRDAEIVRDTDGLYAAEHGDGIDNWIVGRLQWLQREQAVGHQAERQLFMSWLDILGDKLLWMIAGNHPWWTYKVAGYDVVREAVRGTRLLYDPDEVLLTLRLGSAEWRILARHKWRYSSIFNPTHGIEVGWERRGYDFDIGIGGHTHPGTMFREFFKHGRKRLAVQVGTYKINGSFGRAEGYADPVGHGCGMVIFYPDGGLHCCRTLEEGAVFLTHLRATWRKVSHD